MIISSLFFQNPQISKKGGRPILDGNSGSKCPSEKGGRPENDYFFFIFFHRFHSQFEDQSESEDLSVDCQSVSEPSKPL